MSLEEWYNRMLCLSRPCGVGGAAKLHELFFE
jgi:hypothetical protein